MEKHSFNPELKIASKEGSKKIDASFYTFFDQKKEQNWHKHNN